MFSFSLKVISIFRVGCTVFSQPRCELLLSRRDVDEVQRSPSHYPLVVLGTHIDLRIIIIIIVIAIILVIG